MAPEHIFFSVVRSGHASIRVGRRLSSSLICLVAKHLACVECPNELLTEWGIARVKWCSGLLVSFAARQLFTVLMKRACSPSIEKRQVAYGRLEQWQTDIVLRVRVLLSHAARNELAIDKSAGKTCVLPGGRRRRDAGRRNLCIFFSRRCPGTFIFQACSKRAPNITCTQMRHYCGFF